MVQGFYDRLAEQVVRRRATLRVGGLTNENLRWAGAALVGIAMAALVAGCSSRDSSTPVPATAQAPYVCAGVPGEGVELITGA